MPKAEPLHTPMDPRYTDAAKGRYKYLRTQVFVELSEHCSVDHKGRAADAIAALVRPELESTYAVLLESNDLRDQAREALTAESLRADRAENARDQVGEMLHAAQERLGSIRNGVAHIQQLAAATERTHGEDDPVAITLRATARNFLAALGAGDGQDGAQSDTGGRTGPVARDAAREPRSDAQRGAEDDEG
jgi:hypothetical protein